MWQTIKRVSLVSLTVMCFTALSGCISPSNEVIEGLGSPDPTQCSTIPDVEDGTLYQPRTEAVTLATDNRKHPDVFYMAWSKLDNRSDLRFPEKGYDDNGFEDKLLVSRKLADGTTRHWQLLPQLDNTCNDVEKIRLHSFDVAPNGRSLYISMAKTDLDGTVRDKKLKIYRYDLENFTLKQISKDEHNGTHFMYPTYIGNDPITKEEILIVSKTVTKDEIPLNYHTKSELRDEYDRAPTPLIHTMNANTGEINRIGFNNSHQTEPFVMTGPDKNKIAVFTQWEHQAAVNRFALWKMQIDGSDEFTFYGEESATDRRADNIFQGRVVRSGTYKDYILMAQGNRSHNSFAAEGDIVMTFRHHQELRSDRIPLQTVTRINSVDTDISRNPEHYNDQSFIYSYRQDSEFTYDLLIKDFDATSGNGEQLTPETNDYHYVQARSFYPPEQEQVAPTDAKSLGENRVSFTNKNLNGKAGFLVHTLLESDNGVQHQLDGTSANDISMQFFIPSHHFNDSKTIGLQSNPEMSIPASGFIKPESDGSFGAILNEGLYTWKVNKRFKYDGGDLWLPVRAERQEINFVPNRVNACNQCHQERNQPNVDKYENFDSIAAQKMRGDLSGITDITDPNYYNAYYNVPDFHKDIMPLFTSAPTHPDNTAKKSCADCHNAGSKLNLSNASGPETMNATYRTVVLGAHKLPNNAGIVPYSNNSINPLGMENSYHPAPFMWSLLLNDDLSVPADSSHPNNSSRNLDRAGDYGATYVSAVETSIKDINSQYDHSKHWSLADMQKFITYSSTQMPADLSNRSTFKSNALSTSSVAAQKAYQAIVRQCYDCHNDFTNANGEGIEADGYGLPWEKRFASSNNLRNRQVRFVVKRHVANKKDTMFSQYTGQSDLVKAKNETLQSARYRIDFKNTDNSELFRYALGTDLAGNDLNETDHHIKHPKVLQKTAADYLAIENWVKGTDNIANQLPTISYADDNLTLTEYADPAELPKLIRWTDPDGDPVSGSTHGVPYNSTSGELSQAFIVGSGTSEHSFQDTMLALTYQDFNSAKLKTYAILGDRGNQQFTFNVTDGHSSNNTQTIDLTVEKGDYEVPTPSTSLPTNFYAFYTDKNNGALHKLESDPNDINTPIDTVVGTITNYDSHWQAVYRRSDKGWLYFVDQEAQEIHVVDETNATTQFVITLNHEPKKEGDMHKMTNYLVWWRPKEGLDHLSNPNCPDGELQGILESKLSDNKDKNGEWYIGLGCSTADETIVPDHRTKLPDGANTIAAYTWRRATFMVKRVDNGVDHFNVLNLVTGKPKALDDFDFPETTDANTGEVFPAGQYFNARAIVVSEDGRFYGFNKDANDQPVEIFNFDPLQKIQQPVTTPQWVTDYFANYLNYGTPFIVIEPEPEPTLPAPIPTP